MLTLQPNPGMNVIKGVETGDGNLQYTSSVKMCSKADIMKNACG